jgi:hypothetical protein
MIYLRQAFTQQNHLPDEAEYLDEMFPSDDLLHHADEVKDLVAEVITPDEFTTKVPGVYRVSVEDGDITLQANWGRILAIGVLIAGAIALAIGIMRSREEKSRAEALENAINQTANELENMFKDMGKQYHMQESELKVAMAATNDALTVAFKRATATQGDAYLTYVRTLEKGNSFNGVISDVNTKIRQGLETVKKTLDKQVQASSVSQLSALQSAEKSLEEYRQKLFAHQAWPDGDVQTSDQFKSFLKTAINDPMVRHYLLGIDLNSLIHPVSLFDQGDSKQIKKLLEDCDIVLKRMKDKKVADGVIDDFKETKDAMTRVMSLCSELQKLRDLHVNAMIALVMQMGKEKKNALRTQAQIIQYGTQLAKAQSPEQRQQMLDELKGRELSELSDDEFAEMVKKYAAFRIRKDGTTQSDNSALTLQGRTGFFYDPDTSAGSLLNDTQSFDELGSEDQLTIADAQSKSEVACNHLTHLEAIVQSAFDKGTVCRQTVELLTETHGAFLPPSYPAKSFTLQETEQNIDVFKEATLLKKNSVLTAVVGTTASMLGAIQTYMTKNQYEPLLNAIEDLNNQCTDALGEVVDYEVVAATLFSQFNGMFEKSATAKAVFTMYHPMASTAYTGRLLSAREKVVDALKDLIEVGEDLIELAKGIDEGKYLKNVPLLDIPNSTREVGNLSRVGEKDAAFVEELIDIRDDFADIDLSSLDSDMNYLDIQLPFNNTDLTLVREQMATDVLPSEEWAEYVMSSLTLDVMMPRRLVDSGTLQHSEYLNEIITKLNELAFKGKKPHYALANDIHDFSLKAKELSIFCVKLENHVKVAISVYTKLINNKASVVNVLYEEKDKSIKALDVRTLATLVKAVIGK